ncbi:hypothetical protein D7B24_003995 [Verticillium nonalfalfae]|uniref:Predicted protein n=2 Tax=Verticillium TaxID=1036719 RepID=C9SRF9_VERA1|nr:predicted protein [Verticillium alfalfae VaMs.102]XP_028497063.1 uncharacterized protein D7B24_003995 [Verticillium nonalfalfae]EEY21374.1 predicted protein [Verticillium alfalfae VaMs.102]RNJ58905.1 hypothetical protein D7B24_003995 [Verticillium nonalfalfae]
MDVKDTVDGSELSSPDDADRFMLSDHRLLTSGFFADCEIVLGCKTWKLHKSVICLRSKYFERAFMGHWPEAKSGNITLSTDQFTEEQIEWLISFVYTGGS